MMKNNLAMTKNVKGSETKQFIVLSAVLFLLWVLLSGKMEAKLLGMGLAASLFSAWITMSLLRIPSVDRKSVYVAFDFPYVKYIVYWFWLFKEIVKANIDIAKVVLNPKLPINPQIVTFRRPMDNPLAHVTLANSITLTPGTVTVDVEGDLYVIHALTDGAAEGLEGGEGEMMKRVYALFNEEAPKGEEAKENHG